MKVKLIDKKGWEKIIEIKHKVRLILLPSLTNSEIYFELFDIPKKGLPIFKEVIKNGRRTD